LIDFSGVNKCFLPSIYDLKRAPSSEIFNKDLFLFSLIFLFFISSATDPCPNEKIENLHYL